ncbi:hypothetical protein AgCh_026654 [Apium graveolens]
MCVEKSSGSGSGGGGGGGNVNVLYQTREINLQLLRVPDQAKIDEIGKAVMHLKSSEIDEGYTTYAVVSHLVVGEEERVLDIGRSAPNHADSKLYTHDLLLSMAQAEIGRAKVISESLIASEGTDLKFGETFAYFFFDRNAIK